MPTLSTRCAAVSSSSSPAWSRATSPAASTATPARFGASCMRAQFVLSEVGSGLRRNLTMTVAAILNITITLTLLGGALMIRNGADRLQHDVISQLEVSVF